MSSKFPAEYLSLLKELFTPFSRHYSNCTVFWVSSFYLSVNIVVFVPNSRSRVSKVSRTEERFKIAIMFSAGRRRSREERNGFVKADVK